jgi:hypothetical protein
MGNENEDLAEMDAEEFARLEQEANRYLAMSASEKVAFHIKTYGVHIQHVLADEDNPPFSYTVGLTRLNHPEIITFGVPARVADAVLNDLATQVMENDPISTERNYEGVFDGLLVRFRPVKKRLDGHYLRMADVTFEGVFSALQLVWTDSAKLFPWDDGYDQAKFGATQPLICD